MPFEILKRGKNKVSIKGYGLGFVLNYPNHNLNPNPYLGT